jgi:hypothetical protein
MEELRIHHVALPGVIYGSIQTTGSGTKTGGTGSYTVAIQYYKLRLNQL